MPGFDELTCYAEHFDTVEVNSSFYGPPRPETSRAWVERTPAGFEFSLKLHQQFTHPEMYKRSALGDLPDASPEALAALARVTDADVGSLQGRPRSASHRPASLARCWRSFPPSFHDTPANRELPRRGCWRPSGDYPVAVELRHKSWSDHIGETLELLERHRRRVDADRRAEVPVLDPAELPAQQ